MSSILEKLNIDSSSISPEMVNGFLSMLGNPKKDDSNQSESSENHSDISSEDASSADSNLDSDSSSSGIDADTLLRMKSIVEKLNVKEDPRSNLLASLKPYLKESRKDKLDQYIQLMNMSKMVDFLPFMGGGKKDE